MENLKFTLKREEMPVNIDGSPYVLVELDGRERDEYLTNLTSRLRTTKDGGVGGVKSFDGLQASLVAASLFKDDGGERVKVPVTEIQAWPARVVSALFDAAKELSALDEEDEGDEGDEGGND